MVPSSIFIEMQYICLSPCLSLHFNFDCHWNLTISVRSWYISCVVPYCNEWPGISNVNTLRPRQNGRHFPDDILKCIFLNENVWISIKISLKFVFKGPVSNIPALVQIMAWRQPGDKPLSEPMMFNLPTHVCVTRPQWVNAPRCVPHV